MLYIYSISSYLFFNTFFILFFNYNIFLSNHFFSDPSHYIWDNYSIEKYEYKSQIESSGYYRRYYVNAYFLKFDCKVFARVINLIKKGSGQLGHLTILI